jgi:CRISPR-associated protein Cmr2
MSEHIFLIQIGPVQSFIVAARKVQDLAVGSTLLSKLAQSGVEAAQRADVQLLFPMPNANGNLPQSVPHRFAFTSTQDPHEICGKIQTAILDKWDIYAQAVKAMLIEYGVGNSNWETVFKHQVENWLDITWAAVPYDAKQHGDSYKRVNQALAARKQFRAFKQVKAAEDSDGSKCTMTGSQAALNIDWKRLEKALGYEEEVFFRGSEKLGSIALIKRVLPKAHKDFRNFQLYTDITTIAGVPEDNPTGREAERYFAVLHMDGDKMGAALGKLKTREAHQAFSQKLTHFSEVTVRKIEKEYQKLSKTTSGKDRTIVVYAGGDDVLALAPVQIVLNFAEDLRKAFASDMQAYNLHVSAGVSISYYKSPLDIALETARSAEKTAKNEKQYDRNAVVIRETTHSGTIRDAGGKWEDKKEAESIESVSFMKLMDYIRASIASHELSSKIGFDMQQIHFEMGETPETPAAIKDNLQAARAAEIKRIIKRRIGEQVAQVRKAEIMNDLPPTLIQLGESQHCGWEMLANRVIMARFLAQGDKA